MADRIPKPVMDCILWNYRRLMTEEPFPISGHILVVLARDRKRKRCLVVGLGTMGVGQDWLSNRGSEHLTGFADALEKPEGTYLDMTVERWRYPADNRHLPGRALYEAVNATNETEILNRRRVYFGGPR